MITYPSVIKIIGYLPKHHLYYIHNHDHLPKYYLDHDYWIIFMIMITYPSIIYSLELIPLLPRDHECRKVSCINSKEDDSKQSPDRGHEPEQKTR